MAGDAGFDREGFATAFTTFVEAMNASAVAPPSAMRKLVSAHLGLEPDSLPIVTEELANFEHANLQLALDAWAAGDGRSVITTGLAAPGSSRFMGIELADLVAMSVAGLRGIKLGPVQFAERTLPDGQRLLCYESVLLSLVDSDRRLVVLIARAQQRGPSAPPLVLQVMAADNADAIRFLSELRELRARLSIYRGRVLVVAQGSERNPFDQDLNLVHLEQPILERADVVLPDDVLERIERHTIGFAQQLAHLRNSGQSLHRGLLLYGLPGTGKTHVVRYLSGVMAGRTTFIVSGAALGVIAPICQLARDLSPSMVVLEDVDLVAMERTMPGHGHGPLLFTLMNEIEGIGPDADVVFLLTTNRADLLEPALAARPGRIDLAVEIPVPDAACRRRLIILYGRGLTLAMTDIEAIVERTDGVSAAFIKELLRRAALIAATEMADGDATPLRVDDSHLDAALTELLETGGALTRVLLGAQAPAPDQSAGFVFPGGTRFLPPGVATAIVGQPPAPPPRRE